MNICQTCNRPYEVWTCSIEQPYHYTESGLLNVFLAGITVHSCPNCEVESADIPDIDGLHDLISKNIILTPLPMSGAELRFLRKEARLKPREFAERLGVDPKTVTNWESSAKLSIQSDVTVRVLIASKLWSGYALTDVMTQLAQLAGYGWETAESEDIAQLAEENVVMGHANQGWTMGLAAA
jgi:putative transcriptional regulator